MRTIRVRVTLRDVTPTVLRVVDVPASTRLPQLHTLLQAAMGWTDSHLHLFVADEIRYGIPDHDFDSAERDEQTMRLQDMPTKFVYRYDFGDG